MAPIARKLIAKRPREAAAADEASGNGAAPDDAESADEGEAARPRKRKPGPRAPRDCDGLRRGRRMSLLVLNYEILAL